MPKAKVRPPRVPRGESAKVTIANQANQIKNLIGRVQQLEGLYGEALKMRDGWQSKTYGLEKELATARHDLAREHQFRSSDLARYADAQAEILKLQAKLEGYRLHTKDAAISAQAIWPTFSIKKEGE